MSDEARRFAEAMAAQEGGPRPAIPAGTVLTGLVVVSHASACCGGPFVHIIGTERFTDPRQLDRLIAGLLAARREAWPGVEPAPLWKRVAERVMGWWGAEG